jgi:periplasmic protein TonB
MFGGFETQVDAQAKKRWLASTGTSLAIYALIGVVVAIIASRTVMERHQEEPIDVTFHAAAEPEPAVKNEPPPPPPPKPMAAAKRPGRVAPPTPTAIPDQRPPEAEPTGDAVEPGGAGEDFGDGVGGAVAPPPPPPPPPPAPVEEKPIPLTEAPDDLVVPVAAESNAKAVYPETARKKGLEAEVVLKITIGKNGEVTGVKLVRGDEPFASAAIATAKSWHYRPAMLDGKPVAVSRIVNISFKIGS